MTAAGHDPPSSSETRCSCPVVCCTFHRSTTHRSLPVLVRLSATASNSFVKNNLPVSPTHSRIRAEIRLSQRKRGIYQVGKGVLGCPTLVAFRRRQGGNPNVLRYSPTTPSRCYPRTPWGSRRA